MSNIDLLSHLPPVHSADDLCARLGLAKTQHGARQIVTAVYDRETDFARGDAARAKRDLEAMLGYARSYYKKQIPEPALCAYLLARYKISSIENPHADITAGFKVLGQVKTIHPDGIFHLADALSSTYADAAFIGMLQLRDDLAASLRDKSLKGQSHETNPVWLRATKIKWPACPLSIENASAASRLRLAMAGIGRAAAFFAMAVIASGPVLVWNRDAQSGDGHQPAALYSKDRTGRDTLRPPFPGH